MAHTFTMQLTNLQATRLQGVLIQQGYEPRRVQYTQFAYTGRDVTVAVYEKKNKLVVQGKGTDEFVEFVLEPHVTGVLPKQDSLAIESEVSGSGGVLTVPHFGIDESGKGDYFGPLVIGGVYADEGIAAELATLGVCDSKQVSSANKIRELASAIRAVPGIQYHLVSLGPERYNEQYARYNNLNRLLAWGHVAVIAGLMRKIPQCAVALSDQFAKPVVLQQELARQRVHIELVQQVRAESDLAVAAASILARERFVNWMETASDKAGMPLPLGATNHVVAAGQRIVATYGEDMLRKVAKMHFKTTRAVLGLPPLSDDE